MFEIWTKFVPYKNDINKIEGDTAAQVTIKHKHTIFTRNRNKETDEIKEYIYVSTYPMALWLVSSWKKLLNDSKPNGLNLYSDIDDPHKDERYSDWAQDHYLPCAGGGFIWPQLYFTLPAINKVINNSFMKNKKNNYQKKKRVDIDNLFEFDNYENDYFDGYYDDNDDCYHFNKDYHIYFINDQTDNYSNIEFTSPTIRKETTDNIFMTGLRKFIEKTIKQLNKTGNERTELHTLWKKINK